ncbi:uncharacterized protein V1510DRAFT_416220 [Dipodascopsis tothii]|uniref:uncharacterized protein n=1 Tax=Dipodascopsis tothii TaxID=44089 RepID=UPI0034CF4F7C
MWAKIAALVAIYLLIPLVLYLVAPKSDPAVQPRKRAVVLVLGDIGRSPRMQYHVLSLVERGFAVDFCGYMETEPLRELAAHPDVAIHAIPPYEPPARPPAWHRIGALVLAYKAYFLMRAVLRTLRPLKDANFLLVQTPPAVPTLLVCWLYIKFVSGRTHLVVDWHNFGYTILGLKLGEHAALVRLARRYEAFFGRRSGAFANLCVTRRMGEALARDFGLNPYRIVPLHDRPASQFEPIVAEADREAVWAGQGWAVRRTGPAAERVVLTATSYTPDEDLGVLLAGLAAYDGRKAAGGDALPDLFVVVTGKGPLKAEFERAVAAQSPSWAHVRVTTAWLSAEDYPRVVAAADLGVSLHTSSSGVDLPMKVVDMFGCGVPVLSLDFPALAELVVDGRNGRVFADGADLGRQLAAVLADAALYGALRQGALAESKNRWAEHWRITVGSIFTIQNREDYVEVDESDYESDSSHSSHDF